MYSGAIASRGPSDDIGLSLGLTLHLVGLPFFYFLFYFIYSFLVHDRHFIFGYTLFSGLVVSMALA